jgi:hypothetical protein
VQDHPQKRVHLCTYRSFSRHFSKVQNIVCAFEAFKNDEGTEAGVQSSPKWIYVRHMRYELFSFRFRGTCSACSVNEHGPTSVGCILSVGKWEDSSLGRFCHDILFQNRYSIVLIFAKGTVFSARDPFYAKSITMLRATYTPSPGFRTALDDFRDLVSSTHKVKLG